MNKVLKTYKDPIAWVNEMLTEYGHLRQFKNNPISFFIHLFYMPGNGNLFSEVDGESIIGIESWEDEDKDDTPKTTASETLKVSEQLLEMFIKHKSPDRQVKMIEEQIKELKYDVFLEEQEITIKSIQNLDNFEIDVDNPYWKNLEGIVTHNSMADRLPNNLNIDWRYAFEVVEKIMIKTDPEKMAETKINFDRFK